MKQRFSSLDVKVIAHELSQSLVGLRLANVYDLSSKILLLKLARPDEKKQLIIDSGFRCHLTEFVRTTAAAPSPFVARLRKFLKTRRVTSVAQIGTDRIIEFQFSEGQYRLFLEFFASGNVILTDGELKILTLLRNVSEGEGQEPQRVGLTYNLSNRQNYDGVPPLTPDRLRSALRASVEKAGAQPAGKKAKSKAGDELRKGLATTITDLPPVLIDHALAVTKFDVQKRPAEILESEALLNELLQSLTLARQVVEDVTKSPKCTGYIFAVPNARYEGEPKAEEQLSIATKNGLYEDFHPFLPHKYENNPGFKILSFEGFNKTVDEFFSSLEGQKLASRLDEREAAAKRKLEAARQDQANRIGGLQAAQTLNSRKAAAIEANVERVQEAVDAVAGLVQQGMDWEDIGKLIAREQRRHNPVAEIIKLPLNLAENTITLLLGEEDFEDDDTEMTYDTDSDDETVGDDGVAASVQGKEKAVDNRLDVDINLSLSPWSNAREYYDQKRQAAVKEQKTEQQADIAIRNAEQKIAIDLKKGLKQEKAVLQPLRRQLWFEKFVWFVSSDGYLVLGGRDSQQNEILYRRYLRKGDVYVHADLHGAASVIIKNNPKTPDAPVPPSTLSQAGNLSVCTSSAWDAKASMSAWWVTADQVSKSAPTGEFLPAGSFMVRGKKNFLPPAQLLLGFGLMFKVSEESKARHVKHRLYDAASDIPSARADDSKVDEPGSAATAAGEVGEDALPDGGGDDGSDSAREDDDNDNDDEGDEPSARANPLQGMAEEEPAAAEKADAEDTGDTKEELTEKMADLGVSGEPTAGHDGTLEDAGGEDDLDGAEQTRSSTPGEVDTRPQQQPQDATSTTTTSQKKAPPKRGQRGKAKKIAAKYAAQDEEDRALMAAVTGAAGQAKREAEARARAAREADLAAAAERRQQQRARAQRQAAEQEEIRRVLLDEGQAVLDDGDGAEAVTLLDALVGAPLPGDEILEAVPVCAPWAALARVKYKAKMQPGATKKGKAVKEIVERWKLDAGKKGVVDPEGRDAERMWPREVELIRGLRPEELFNCVPVGKLKVMTSGGAGGGGGGGGDGQKGRGGGGRGGKGQKKR